MAADSSRWKYLVTELKPSFFGHVPVAKLQAELDRQGSAGWELVQLNQTQPFRHVQLVFKRPV